MNTEMIGSPILHNQQTEEEEKKYWEKRYGCPLTSEDYISIKNNLIHFIKLLKEIIRDEETK